MRGSIIGVLGGRGGFQGGACLGGSQANNDLGNSNDSHPFRDDLQEDNSGCLQGKFNSNDSQPFNGGHNGFQGDSGVDHNGFQGNNNSANANDSQPSGGGRGGFQGVRGGFRGIGNSANTNDSQSLDGGRGGFQGDSGGGHGGFQGGRGGFQGNGNSANGTDSQSFVGGRGGFQGNGNSANTNDSQPLGGGRGGFQGDSGGGRGGFQGGRGGFQGNGNSANTNDSQPLGGGRGGFQGDSGGGHGGFQGGRGGFQGNGNSANGTDFQSSVGGRGGFQGGRGGFQRNVNSANANESQPLGGGRGGFQGDSGGGRGGFQGGRGGFQGNGNSTNTNDSQSFGGGRGSFQGDSGGGRSGFQGGRGGFQGNGNSANTNDSQPSGGGRGGFKGGRGGFQGNGNSTNTNDSQSFGGGRGSFQGDSGGGRSGFQGGRGGFQGNGNSANTNDSQPLGGGRGGFQGGHGGFQGNGNSGNTKSSHTFGSGCGGFQGGSGGFQGNVNSGNANDFRPSGGGRGGLYGGRGGFQGNGNFTNANDSQLFGGGRGGFQGGNGGCRSGFQTGRNGFQEDSGVERGGFQKRFHSDRKDFQNRGGRFQGDLGDRPAFGTNRGAFGNADSGIRFGRNASFGENLSRFGSDNCIGNSDESKENAKEREGNYERYVPPIRPVEELFKEDSEHAEQYRMIVDDDEDVATSGHDILHSVAIDTWEDAKFEPQLITNIVQHSMYVRPRKIQANSIPIILEGRDIKGHAETGSGKTAAFMLPIINMLMKTERIREPLSSPKPFAIVIEPTRELCSQVYEQGRKFAHDTGVSVAKAYGQFDQRVNMRELQCGCDILCATPGRLMHFIASCSIGLDRLKYLVFDEADRLLEHNFLGLIKDITSFSGFPKKEDRQTLLFSATYPKEIQDLAEDVLRPDNVMVSNKKLVATSGKVVQSFISVERDRKKQALLDLLAKVLKNAKEENRIERTLVFVKTKREADLLSLWLSQQDIKSTTVNGDRTQPQREKALRDFRTGDACVLVSTDVCARGIDIKDLDHVINYDLPDDHIVYVHRIGRTGRVKGGYATSFFDETSESDLSIARHLVEFLKDVKQQVPEFLENIVNGNDTRTTQMHEQSSLPKFGAPSPTSLPKFGNMTAATGSTNTAQINGGGNAQPKKNDKKDDDPWAADSDGDEKINVPLSPNRALIQE